MNAFTFPPPPSTEAEAPRAEVGDFLSQQLASRKPVERAESWTGMDTAFSAVLARTMMHAPSFSLRGIIARGLGLR